MQKIPAFRKGEIRLHAVLVMRDKQGRRKARALPHRITEHGENRPEIVEPAVIGVKRGCVPHGKQNVIIRKLIPRRIGISAGTVKQRGANVVPR